MHYMSSDDRELNGLRGQIDRLDLELLDVLMERMKIVDKIGEYKRKSKLEIPDEKREKEVLRGVVERGRSRGLSGEMVRKIFESIIHHSKERE